MRVIIDSKKKITTVVTIVTIAVVILLFFGVYGFARIHTLVLSGANIHGSVNYDEFKERNNFNIAEYPSIVVDKQAKVLYLSDTHFVNYGWHADALWTMDAVNRSVMRDIRELVKRTDPDLIVITGDAVTDTLNDRVFMYMVDFYESLEVPWTFTFGNHDAEHRADKPKISNILDDPQLKYCKYEQGPINLQGLGNSMVVIKDTSGKLMQAVVTVDTGDWKRAEKPGKPFSTYTVGIADSQVKWYNWIIDGLTAANGGSVLPTTVACHVPNDAYNFALQLGRTLYGDKSQSVDNFREEGEVFNYTGDGYNSYIATNKFMHSIASKGSTTNIVSGHSHSAGYAAVYNGITYTSVAKTGDIYTNYEWDGGKRGGTLMTISGDGSVVENIALHV